MRDLTLTLETQNTEDIKKLLIHEPIEQQLDNLGLTGKIYRADGRWNIQLDISPEERYTKLIFEYFKKTNMTGTEVLEVNDDCYIITLKGSGETEAVEYNGTVAHYENTYKTASYARNVCLILLREYYNLNILDDGNYDFWTVIDGFQ